MKVHVSLPFLVVAIIFASMYWLYNNANTDASQNTTLAYTAGRMTSNNWNNLPSSKKG